jgi:rhombotail lipoprotein
MVVLFWLVIALPLSGCQSFQEHRHASAIDYLYPSGRVEAPTGEVKLELPLRVGVAFAPGGKDPGAAFSEPQRREILKRVTEAFREIPEVQFVEVLPTHNLDAKGGFENLQQAAGMYGMNLVALVSYDQIQFGEPRVASILYWTLIGTWFIEGERIETHTLLDANVFEPGSRALLFSGSGSSIVKDGYTPWQSEEKKRASSVLGFEKATQELIENLGFSLNAFREHAKQGTVRGMGTPRVQVHDTAVTDSAVTAGAGALGPFEIVIAVALVATASWSARRRGD